MKIAKNFDYIMYTDGGSRGNPGPAALGVIILNGRGERIKSYGEFLGEKTNNEAEYEAVIFGLKKLKQLFGGKAIKKARVLVRSDSELLVSQLMGKYKIEADHIADFFIKIWNLKIDFSDVQFEHVPRAENQEADRMVNQALDSEQKMLF